MYLREEKNLGIVLNDSLNSLGKLLTNEEYSSWGLSFKEKKRGPSKILLGERRETRRNGVGKILETKMLRADEKRKHVTAIEAKRTITLETPRR